jgi:hypothetical protein
MKTSESVAKISPAIISAHKEMTDVKRTAVNDFSKSEYAELESVLKVIRPVLAKNNLALVQMPGFKDGCLFVASRIIHDSGEWIEEEVSVGPLPPDPQKSGAAITYLRRYSAMAVCGIAPEDDDASIYSKKKKPGQKAVEKQQAPTEKTVEAIIKALPDDVKTLLRANKVDGIWAAHKIYKSVAGDVDAMRQLLQEKIRKGV